MKSKLTGETYPSRAGAAFDDAAQAQAAVSSLIASLNISAEQISVLAPHARHVEKKLEPETRGIATTLARTHIILGAAGLVTGFLAAGIFTLTGVPPFADNPFYTALALAFLGTLAGLFVAGLITLRPDHDRVVLHAMDALRCNRWFVLVYARTHREAQRVLEILQRSSRDAVGTV